MIDPIVGVSFSVFENKGVYALLLGSGISRAAQIPTGWEITIELVRRLARLQGVEEQVDWSEWYKAKFGKDLTYSDVLDALASTPDQRRSILHAFIEPSEDDVDQNRKIPTKAHRAIAALVRDGFFKVIVTTNFDRLLENSLREVGVEPVIIRSDDDLKGAVPLMHARCYILKLHGDYLDTRIRNTESELSTYSKAINSLLDRIFDEFGLIVCGWSADWDAALRSAISRAPSRRYTTYWTTRSKPTGIAQDLILKRSAQLVQIKDAEEFFTTLQLNVQTQANFQKQDPRSVELLIANAKRLLVRAEDRIRLEELISQEIKLLNDLLNGEEFVSEGSLSDDRLLRVIARYESVVEPSVRLFGILGRWGDGLEYRAVLDVIRNLVSLEPRAGLVVLNKLRTYPARLLLFSYGMGLLKAERYVDLFRLFTSPISRAQRRETTLVQSLIAWDGGDKELWNRLEEFPQHNHLTPLSDHLHKLFLEWTGDYLVFPKNEFTQLFEGFELLGSLAYMGVTQDEQSIDKAVTAGYDQNFVWAPIGRSSWDGETSSKVFEEWRRPDISASLIAAGFARKSGPYLEKAIQSIENLSSRMRW